MTAAATSLSWDETLAALLGLLGSPVSVTLIDGQSDVVVASMRGVLTAGTDLSDGEDGGQLYFRFEDECTGFMLARDAFRRAGVLDDASLAVSQGVVGLIVTREP